MTTDTKDIIEKIIKDIFSVYEVADKETGILRDANIPTNFHEPNPDKILESCLSRIQGNPDEERVSILQKHEDNPYKSPYSLYHDLKIASLAAIIKHKVGSAEYKSIDFFYKFATELLLREISRHKLSKVKSGNTSDESEFESQLSEEFYKISTHYSVSNGEVLVFINEVEEPLHPSHQGLSYAAAPSPESKLIKQHLFTHLVGRSAVDPRHTVVPEPYQLSKVVPLNRNVTENHQLLKALSPTSQRIPPPTTQPTQVLDNFFHPNWYTIDAPKWITYKQDVEKPAVESSLLNSSAKPLEVMSRVTSTVTSFAPSADSRNSVLSEELNNSVWLHHIGFKEIKAIRRKYLNKSEPLKEQTEEEDLLSKSDDKSTTDEANSDDDSESDKQDDEQDANDVEMKDADQAYEPRDINIANVIRYNPENISSFNLIKKEKESLSKSPRHVQKLISSYLLKLNEYRQNRYLNGNPGRILPPSTEEVRLYQKIEKLITILLELKNSTSDPLTLRFSKKIPVLLNEYSGTLPGGLPPSKAIPKSNRLPSINSRPSRASARKRR